MRGKNDKNLWEQDWWIEIRMKIIHYFKILFKKALLI